MALRLALTMVIAGVVGADPTALVRRLGASKYADRESAAAALEKIGPEALPALRAGRAARDAEVRMRAEGLIQRIENDVLVRPSLVALDFQDRPLDEVVAEIGARGHARLTLAGRDPALASRRVTLDRDEPVPFWSAVEQVSLAAGLDLGAGNPAVGLGPQPDRSSAYRLFALPPGQVPGPRSVSGPFRVGLLSLSYHKERNYAGHATNGGMIPFPNGGMARRGGFDPMNPGIGPAGEQFAANLQVLAEPRVSIALAGPIRLVEALDDRGNSLQPPSPNGRPMLHHSGYNRVEMPGGAAVQATLSLKYPEEPGKVIRRLAGTIPLTVSARKEEALVIPLADARGRTYARSDVGLTVHEARLEPDTAQATVELSFRSLDPSSTGNGIGPGETFAVQGPGHPQSQLEFADAQGRVYRSWDTVSQMQGPDGVRVTIKVSPAEGLGPVSEIRYYEIARVITEAQFDFRDVPMP